MHKIVLNHVTSTVLSGADSKSNFVNPYVTEPQCLNQFLLLRESKRNKKSLTGPELMNRIRSDTFVFLIVEASLQRQVGSRFRERFKKLSYSLILFNGGQIRVWFLLIICSNCHDRHQHSCGRSRPHQLRLLLLHRYPEVHYS